LSYYFSTVKLNAEGDIVLRDETVQSLGSFPMFLNILFGSIIRLATPPKRQHVPDDESRHFVDGIGITEVARLPASSVPNEVNFANITNKQHQIPNFKMDAQEPAAAAASDQIVDSGMFNVDVSRAVEKNSSLTDLIIDPGYFAAGGIAGAVSRTVTAPLDRLKVYLIANTGVPKDSLEAVKHGEPLKAVKQMGRPLIDACKELWKAGGVRSLFAGMFINQKYLRL
jgi:solute carrier family 25 (mitochondrial phosphate transporter), member 23/24/25/41